MSDSFPNLSSALANFRTVFMTARDEHYKTIGLPRVSKQNSPHSPLAKIDRNAQFGFLEPEAGALAKALLETRDHRKSADKFSQIERLRCSRAHRLFLYTLKSSPNNSSDTHAQNVYRALDRYVVTANSLYQRDKEKLLKIENQLRKVGILAADERLLSEAYRYHAFVEVLEALGLNKAEILDIWKRSEEYESKLEPHSVSKSVPKHLTKRQRKNLAYQAKREMIESKKKAIDRPEAFLFNDDILHLTRFIDHVIKFQPDNHDFHSDIISKLKTTPLRELVDTRTKLDPNNRQFYYTVLKNLPVYNPETLTPIVKEIAQKVLDKPFFDLLLKHHGLKKEDLVNSCLKVSKPTLEKYQFNKNISKSHEKSFLIDSNNFAVISMVENYLKTILIYGPKAINSLEEIFSKINYISDEWKDAERLVDILKRAGGINFLEHSDLVNKFFELYVRGDRQEFFCWPERYNPKAGEEEVTATGLHLNGLGMFLHNVSLVKDPERKKFFLNEALDPSISFRQAEANLNQYLFPVGNGYTQPKNHKSYTEYLSALIGKSMRFILPPFNIWLGSNPKVREKKLSKYIKFQQQGLATTTRATWLSENLHSLETDTHSHYHPAILSEFANVCAKKSYLFYSSDRKNRPVVLEGLSPPKAFYIEGTSREAYREINDILDMVFNEGYFGHKRYSGFKNDLKSGLKDIQNSQIVHGNGFMMVIPPVKKEYTLPGKVYSKLEMPSNQMDDTHYSYVVFNKKNNTAPYQIAYLVPTTIVKEFVQDYAVEMKDGFGVRNNQKNFKDCNLTISMLEKKAKEKGLLILNLATPANLSALALGSYPIDSSPYQHYKVGPDHKIMPNVFGNVRLVTLDTPLLPNFLKRGIKYLAGDNAKKVKTRIIDAQDHLYKRYSGFQGLADAYLILLSQWHRGITLERRFSDYMLNRAKIIHDHLDSSQANFDEYPILISTNTITGGNSLELRTWLDTKDLTLHTFENGSAPTEYQEYTYDPLNPQEFTDRFLTAFTGERGLGVDLTNDLRFVSRSEFENIIRNKGVRNFEY